MRAIFSACLLAATLAALPAQTAAAEAPGDQATGLVFDSIYLQTSANFNLRDNGSLENPSNALGIDTAEIVPDAVIAGRLYQVVFEVSCENDYLALDKSDPIDANIDECYLELPLGDRLSFFLGKHRVYWDSTPFMRPLDFFDTDRVALDPEDKVAPDDGRLGIGVDYVASAFEAALVFFDDRWASVDYYNLRGGMLSGLKLHFLFDPVSLNVAGNLDIAPDGSLSPAFGYTVSSTFGEGLQLYSSAVLRRGSLQVLSAAALDAGPAFYPQNPFGVWNEDSPSWYPEFTAGVQWTPNDANSLYLSYLYDGNKYDGAEWDRLNAAMAFHQGAEAVFYPAAIVDANQAWDGQISTELLVRRHHAEAHWDLKLGVFEPSLDCILCLEDASGVSKLGLKIGMGDSVALTLGWFGFWGGSGTEFGDYPLRDFFETKLVYTIK
jgi:hypothetical protein